MAGSRALTVLAVMAAAAGQAAAARSQARTAADAEALEAAAPSTGGLDALLALDANNDGKVGRAEIEAFARSQGLSADEVQAEFRDLDVNGDGELEADELGSSIDGGSEPAASASAEALPQQATAQAPEAPAAPPSAVIPADLALSSPQVPPQAAAAELAAAAAKPAAAVQAAADAPEPEPAAQPALEGLYKEAQQHASVSLAEVFAQKVSAALVARDEDTQKADALEAKARQLRLRSAQVRRAASAETANAAKQATDAVLRESAQRMRLLQEAAAKDAQQAAARQREASEAMQRAQQARAEMSAAAKRWAGVA